MGFNTKRIDGGTRRPITRWGSDEDLMRPGDSLSEEGKEGGAKGVVIGLRELDADAKTSMLEPPRRTKFPEIRIANTWEVKVAGKVVGGRPSV